MRLTHVMKVHLLCSKSTDLNVNHIFKNTFTETSILVFDQKTNHHSLAKVTHKINHHSWCPFCFGIMSFFFGLLLHFGGTPPVPSWEICMTDKFLEIMNVWICPFYPDISLTVWLCTEFWVFLQKFRGSIIYWIQILLLRSPRPFW